jgi:hypothetical protein
MNLPHTCLRGGGGVERVGCVLGGGGSVTHVEGCAVVSGVSSVKARTGAGWSRRG